MSSLLLDVLVSVFVDPFVDYFAHDLTLGRVILRVVSVVTLFLGLYLAFLRAPPLAYVGWGLLVPATLLVLYDTLTASLATRG